MATLHTFVVLAHRESPFLDGCLETLSRQTEKSRVVIATSTPCSFISRIAEKWGVPVIVNKAGGGIGADWNFGLRSAGSRFVTLVHQDDTYHPHFLACSLKLLTKYDAALCFTGYDEIDDYGRQTVSKISRAKHLMDALCLGAERRLPAWRMRLYLAFGVALPCSSVTYDMNQMGDFQFATHYKANLDWDAWLRLVEAGKQFVREPSPLVGRRHNALTATSAALASGARALEDREMFERIWPKPVAAMIAAAYRAGY